MRVAIPVILVVAASGGCKRGADAGRTAPSATSTSSSPAPTVVPPTKASASATTSAAGSAAGVPVGTGVATWKTADETKDCALRSRDLDPNLASGGIAIAAKGKDFGVSFFYVTKTKGEGLVAFAGYDTQTRTLSIAHGLGKGILVTPRVFPRKDGWLATWFDAQGLVYAKATWAATLPSFDRLPAVTSDVAMHTSIVRTKSGAVVATAPLTPGESAQLGLFQFAPEDEGNEPAVRAMGASHDAHKPEHPALVETEDGFLVAWEDGADPSSRRIVVARFDATGKELDKQRVLSTDGRPAARPAVANTATGALLAWSEGPPGAPVVVVRALDAKGAPSGPSHVVGPGDLPTLTSTATGAALSFIRRAEGTPPHVAVVHVGEDGAPAPSGVIVSELVKGRGAVSDRAGVALGEDGRLGFAFTYVDGMRGAVRSIKDEGCVAPAGATPAGSASAAGSAPAPAGSAP